jgi:glycosyltransferase involved in cell wall biosynthesis
MKILLCLTRGDTIGGAQTHILTISKQYINNNHIVKLVIGHTTNDFKELLIINNIDFVEIPFLLHKISIINDIKSFIRINEITNEFKPDLISLHSTKIGLIGRLMKFTQKSPIILTVHGWSFSKGIPLIKRSIAYAVELIFARIPTNYILVSKYDMSLANYLFLNKSCYKLIYNGVEPVKHTIINKTIKLMIKIVMIARFDDQKNQKMLIDACSEYEDIELHLIGDGPQLTKLKNYVLTNKLKCKIKFHGQIPNAINEIPEYDIFALISKWEGFPISTIEAMSQGKPIIVSNTGGAPEAVLESFNGYIIDNLESLKKAINNFRNNPSLIKLFGDNSKIRYEENFTAYKMGEETLDYYKEILSSKSKNKQYCP